MTKENKTTAHFINQELKNHPEANVHFLTADRKQFAAFTAERFLGNS